MGAGRPPKYEAKRVAQEVRDYVSSCKSNNYLPTLEGLAVHLEIGRQTIYDWYHAHKEFSYIVEQLLAAQASMLQQNGLVNNYNASITKLLLTKHKGVLDQKPYSDKVETDITTGGDKISFNVVAYGDNPTLQVPAEDVPASSTESTG